jgi:transposase
MKVSHFILQQCDCPNCGKTVKAQLPPEKATGYGPRFTALIGELSGIKAMSRKDVKQFCESVLQIPISTGTIQKIIDRNSEALLPVYEGIGQIARSFLKAKATFPVLVDCVKVYFQNTLPDLAWI